MNGIEIDQGQSTKQKKIDICWYCDRNLANMKYSVARTIKISSDICGEATGKNTMTVNIPRCKSCNDIHSKEAWVNISTALIFSIAFVCIFLFLLVEYYGPWANQQHITVKLGGGLFLSLVVFLFFYLIVRYSRVVGSIVIKRLIGKQTIEIDEKTIIQNILECQVTGRDEATDIEPSVPTRASAINYEIIEQKSQYEQRRNIISPALSVCALLLSGGLAIIIGLWLTPFVMHIGDAVIKNSGNNITGWAGMLWMLLGPCLPYVILGFAYGIVLRFSKNQVLMLLGYCTIGLCTITFLFHAFTNYLVNLSNQSWQTSKLKGLAAYPELFAVFYCAIGMGIIFYIKSKFRNKD